MAKNPNEEIAEMEALAQIDERFRDLGYRDAYDACEKEILRQAPATKEKDVERIALKMEGMIKRGKASSPESAYNKA